jgi:hypothetical protein
VEFFCFGFFLVLEFEHRASHKAVAEPFEPLCHPCFLLDIFEIGFL